MYYDYLSYIDIEGRESIVSDLNRLLMIDGVKILIVNMADSIRVPIGTIQDISLLTNGRIVLR